MRKTIAASLMGLVLALSLVGTGFATTVNPFWGTSDKYLDAYHTVDTGLSSAWYSNGFNYSTPQILAPTDSTSPQIHGTFNIVLTKDWSTSDTITVGLYSTTRGLLTSLSSSGFDTATGLPYKAIYFDLYGQYDSGASYYLMAKSTAGSDDQWRVSSDSFSFETNGVNAVVGRDQTTAPTPLPAAVWMLGSGLVGLAGWKRFRNNV